MPFLIILVPVHSYFKSWLFFRKRSEGFSTNFVKFSRTPFYRIPLVDYFLKHCARSLNLLWMLVLSTANYCCKALRLRCGSSPGCGRSSHRWCSVRNGVLRNFPKFTEKHLCQGLFFNKVSGLRPERLSWFLTLFYRTHCSSFCCVLGREQRRV